jgi:hypothetical protein
MQIPAHGVPVQTAKQGRTLLNACFQLMGHPLNRLQPAARLEGQSQLGRVRSRHKPTLPTFFCFFFSSLTVVVAVDGACMHVCIRACTHACRLLVVRYATGACHATVSQGVNLA